MSSISTKPFTCPECGHKGEFKMYNSVNVTLDPKLKDRVLNGDIFDWTCPKCGESLSVRYNLLYHDMDNKFQIYYSPTECERLNKIMNEMLAKYPGMRKTVRTVDSLNALREKIYVFEEGLNDIAIELSKLFLKNVEKDSIEPNSELRFEQLIVYGKDMPKEQLLFRKIIDNQPQKGMILLEKEYYDNFVKDLATNDNFKMHNYCETIDEEWINKHI